MIALGIFVCLFVIVVVLGYTFFGPPDLGDIILVFFICGMSALAVDALLTKEVIDEIVPGTRSLRTIEGPQCRHCLEEARRAADR